MSDARKYDHPQRLLRIGGLVRGEGSTMEEAQAAKAAAKRALVPRVTMTPPAGTTVKDADALMVRILEEIFVDCAQIRGVLEAMPEGTWPAEFRDIVLTQLYEVLSAADIPWQALTPEEPARMSLPGFFARVTRNGQKITGVRFGPGRDE